ncbi:hypothetical protein BDZ89DRAFT_1068712 [Hymenopellis radicata]|nr:hypothetical protein BDZ89DRAFT_1068712 [Hymenopellis radicata]
MDDKEGLVSLAYSSTNSLCVLFAVDFCAITFDCYCNSITLHPPYYFRHWYPSPSSKRAGLPGTGTISRTQFTYDVLDNLKGLTGVPPWRRQRRPQSHNSYVNQALTGSETSMTDVLSSKRSDKRCAQTTLHAIFDAEKFIQT